MTPKRIFNDCFAFRFADQNPYGWAFAVQPNGIVENSEVKLHFADVLRLELTDFQLHRYERTKPAMKQEQINEVFLVVNFDAILTSNEGKHPAHLQQERF